MAEEDLRIVSGAGAGEGDLKCFKVERIRICQELEKTTGRRGRQEDGQGKRANEHRELEKEDDQKKGKEKDLTHVYEVRLCRPERRNAMNETFWIELQRIFKYLDGLASCRCILLTSDGPVFTSGLDLQYASRIFFSSPSPSVQEEDAVEGKEREEPDAARKAYVLKRFLRFLQTVFTCVEKCEKPVIACVDGPCVGSGVDMICACDLRVATRSENTWFSIKEIDLGLAADVGTLQRLPRLVGHDGWIRELAYTGRNFSAEEAYRHGFLNFLAKDRDEMREKALVLALTISAKTPVGIIGIKHALNYATRRHVDQELENQAIWNAAMLQTRDIPIAIAASLSAASRGKKKPKMDEEAHNQEKETEETDREEEEQLRQERFRAMEGILVKAPVFASL